MKILILKLWALAGLDISETCRILMVCRGCGRYSYLRHHSPKESSNDAGAAGTADSVVRKFG
ncbi:hypothetical protein KIN20_014576 [Parelaphostrongylus tenuis]|uniref:Uncharacterized protein n=1 Tax=Parelaphostrongylus tenuis TaxID=148309 RepID=A0AAD5QPE3_PARTN|nr:hypothetical protein KIN20_014576 [Parelaphostrongylus tenuis]